MAIRPDAPTQPPLPTVDRLATLLRHVQLRAQLFHAGPLCGVTHYGAHPGRGYLHVMRRGETVITHQPRSGAPKRLHITEPSVLFYPRPLAHDFQQLTEGGSDFTCATVEFQGGEHHPLPQALPPVLVVPLAQLPALEHTLALLFAETQAVRCGQYLLANRLLEVLLLQLLRWMVEHPPESGAPLGLLKGLSHPKLARSLAAMHETPGDAWSLPRLATHAGMSRSTFAAAFKAHMGIGPAEYLAQWRLSIAQSRLRDGAPLTVLAHELGYSSASALSRVFSHKLGVAPRDWLKQQRNAG